MNWRWIGVGVLLVAVLGTALGAVYSKHRSRKLFVSLEQLHQQRDELNIQWGRLQLEQSTWATHGRIEQIARERLGMTLPGAADTVIVTY